jgi:predicted O-linked N-acetylglucosamine transferase (SPINDLY family)
LADGLLAAGDSVGATEIYQRIINEDPRLARAWYSLGCVLEKTNDFAKAETCFAKAVDVDAEWLEARHNRARCLYETGQVDPAFEEFQICARSPKPEARHSRAMLAVIVPGATKANHETIRQIRQNWATQDLSAPTERSFTIRRDSERLCVGYVSSFFHRDNWMKPVWGLINAHDRRVVEVHLFSDAARSSIKHGYKEYPADRFYDTSRLDNEAFCGLIREQRIDVLVDLNGYSNMRRLELFALKPAPVIIGWFNMYATTGMNVFNYLIGDATVARPDEERFFTEQIRRVSGSYLTFRVDYPVPEIRPRQHSRNEGAVFGSLASQYKITGEVIATWSRILDQTPGTRLLIKNSFLGTAGNREFLVRQFAWHGIKENRLVLEGPEPHWEFLRTYERIDLVLDTFPYNGGTTTTEALWQGIPVLTFLGDRWASRTSASLLHAAGLDEFIAPDLEGFVALAVNRALEPDASERLAAFRRTVREMLASAPVCDTESFAREMEEIYRSCLAASV